MLTDCLRNIAPSLPNTDPIQGQVLPYTLCSYVRQPWQSSGGRCLIAYRSTKSHLQNNSHEPSTVLDNHKLTAFFRLPGTFMPHMGLYDAFFGNRKGSKIILKTL